jgi:hypothetical protein
MSDIITPLNTPTALEAFRVEAPSWRAIGFDEDNPTIFDVRREFGEYALRTLHGTTDKDYIEKLDHEEPRGLDADEALHLRRQYDIHWRERPIIAGMLSVMHQKGILAPQEQGADLEAQKSKPTEKRPNDRLQVSVTPGGVLRVRIDDPGYFFGDKETYLWHQYTLYPDRFFASHTVQPRGQGAEARYRNDAIDSDTINTQVKNALGKFAS